LSDAATVRADHRDLLRWHVLGAIALTAIVAGIGMVANLYVTIPLHHAGANPGNYVTGSAESFGWVVAHGAVALAIHAVLGLLLGFMVVRIAFTGLSHPRRAVHVWLTMGALLVVGAGFNGLSFLDFQTNANSLVMAALALAAMVSFAGALVALSAPSRAG
jgi:hypothetical protein